MPRVRSESDINHAIELYRSGMPVKEIAAQVGAAVPTVYGWMQKRGITRPKRKFIPNLDEVIERYMDGEPMYKLEEFSGLTRMALRRRLEELGVPIRGNSEATKLIWDRLSPEQRAAQVAPAHDATRGRTLTEDELRKQAVGRFRNRSASSSRNERLMRAMLESCGLPSTPQLPVGKYNLDLAIESDRVAVECFGGGWHAYGRHAGRHCERFKYILDQGWSAVVVWICDRRFPLSPDAAGYVRSFVDELRSNPTIGRQYRVIGGDGNELPARKSYLNDTATIERLGCSDHPTVNAN